MPLPAVTRGRVQLRLYTSVKGDRPPFQLFNVYFKSGGEYSFNSRLIAAMATADPHVATFLCGDLNFVESLTDTTSATFSSPPASFLELWSTFKSKFDLFDPPHNAHTFFHITNDPSSPYSWSSRLDRFLLPSFLASNPIVSPVVSIPSHPTNLRPASPSPLSFSDHLPVRISFEGDSVSRPGHPTIPTWLASSPEYATTLRELWASQCTHKGAYRTLKNYKNILFRAASITRKKNLENMSASLLLSHHINLLRHINAPSQTLITSLLSCFPVLLFLLLFALTLGDM